MPELLSVQFRDIQGFTSLNYRQSSLGGVFITDCNDLVSVSAPNCTTIDGYDNRDFLNIEPVQIGFCDALTSISFSALTYLKGGLLVTDCPALTSVNFSALVELDTIPPGGGGSAFWLTDCNALTSISFPALTTITKDSGFRFAFIINFCSSLATISFPNVIIPDGTRLLFSNNALTQASVDHILARGVASAGFVTGSIELRGGTNSAPSVAGAADAATLIARGVEVYTN